MEGWGVEGIGGKGNGMELIGSDGGIEKGERERGRERGEVVAEEEEREREERESHDLDQARCFEVLPWW